MRALTETEIDLIAGASHGNGSSVTVTGPPRYPSTWMPWTGSGGSGGDYGGNGGSDPPPPPPDPYADRVVIDPSVPPALHDRAAAAQQKMIAELHELAEKYSHVPPGTHINLNGHDVTAEQLRNAVEKLSFTITWGQDYGPNSNGANDAGNVHINLDKLEGYINQDHDWADWGTNWLINHEVGHLLREIKLGSMLITGTWLQTLPHHRKNLRTPSHSGTRRMRPIGWDMISGNYSTNRVRPTPQMN